MHAGPSKNCKIRSRVVVLVSSHIWMINSNADVLHSWAVPCLGINCDAIPGHMTEASLLIERGRVARLLIYPFLGRCKPVPILPEVGWWLETDAHGCMACRDPGALLETWILMELADRGSLSDALRAGRFPTHDFTVIFRCLLDIASGAYSTCCYTALLSVIILCGPGLGPEADTEQRACLYALPLK